MSLDAAPVASSATPDAPPPVPDLSALTSEQRSHWQLTGETLTTDRPTDGAADSSPAPAGDQPASTEASTSADSEPAKGKGVKARSAELEAEIVDLRDKLKLRAQLRTELAAMRQPTPDVPAASSPASAPQLDQVLRAPDPRQPMLSEAQFFERYPDAPYSQFGLYQTRYVLAQDRAEAAETQQQQHVQQTWEQSQAAARSEFPDYDVQLAQFAAQDLPLTPANTAMTRYLQQAGNARLLYALATTHRGMVPQLIQMPPQAALVELGRLDAQFTKPATPAPPAITKAPPPPPSLSSRATVPADDLDGALAAGDYRRYKELANKRDVAARRG